MEDGKLLCPRQEVRIIAAVDQDMFLGEQHIGAGVP
jgi:hypothetical protein